MTMLNVEDDSSPAIEELIKHWLLDIAVEFPRNLGLLFPLVESEALNVKTINGLKPEGYAKTLIDLFGSGMIRFSSELPGDDVHTQPGISRILERFLGLSQDDSILRRDGLLLKPYQRQDIKEIQVMFQLTALGGEAWERCAQPEWDQFFTQFSDYETGELTSPNLNLLMARLGWFQELSGERIQLDTIRLKTRCDYPILYWKRLTHVYQASFSVEPLEPRWANAHNGEPKWFREWWESTAAWYIKPWQLQDWPSK